MNEPQSDTGSGFPRWLTWSLLGGLAVLGLGYGAIFLYANVLNDSPDEFDRSDLDAALGADGSSVDPATGGSDPDLGAEAGSIWTATGESQVGYRVKEILFGVDAEGVGRTDEVDGSITIEGTRVVAAGFVVDVASIESDDGRRDSQFRGRIMSTDEFPDAVFALTEPIELGAEPTDGVQVDTIASGDLTLRGVTNAVTFDVTAEQQDGRIGVLGSIPIVFTDYAIANPSFGGITTEDEGLLEFVLVFEPAS